MLDLNSLEKFNQIYANEKEASYAPSLLGFFESIVVPRIPPNAKILDLGSGPKSFFEDTNFAKENITAIDFSSVAIERARDFSSAIHYEVLDITTHDSLKKEAYDLIFDSHCLHCITDKDQRHTAFQNIYSALKKDEGLFCAEMMAKPIGKEVFLPNKFVESTLNLEHELQKHGFKIIYFLVVRELRFANENGDCDLLRLMARK